MPGPRYTGPGSIFICYRREDSADVTGRIYDRLVDRFGPERGDKRGFDLISDVLPFDSTFTTAAIVLLCGTLLAASQPASHV
jgi:hypothetical protein